MPITIQADDYHPVNMLPEVESLGRLRVNNLIRL
jgi:hypothetical protein